jgi:hypothetical protein
MGWAAHLYQKLAICGTVCKPGIERQQHPGRVSVALACRQVQRGTPVAVAGVKACASPHQSPRHAGVPATGRLVQRRAPLAVAGNINSSASRQQCNDSVCVAAPGCMVQCCAAKVVVCVDLCPLLPQRQHEAGVPAICRLHQCCAAATVMRLNPGPSLEKNQCHVNVTSHCRLVQRAAAVAACGVNCCSRL